MTTETPVLNEHNKAEYPPMHTAEHILNATMVKLYGCPRSKNAHIERKKSKCDYLLYKEPSQEEVMEIEKRVNEVISSNLPVTIEFVSREEAASIVDLSKLPEDASETLRLVYIGDYDVCPCLGAHVEQTNEIGSFRISSTSYNDGNFRIVFRVAATQ